jgi:gas vesicle protein
MNNNNSAAFLVGALFGAVVGGVAALMFSPGTGEQNRRLLVKNAKNTKRYLDQRIHDAEEAYEDFREDAEDFLHAAEKKVEPLKKEVSKYAVSALDQLEEGTRDVKKKFFKGVKI